MQTTEVTEFFVTLRVVTAPTANVYVQAFWKENGVVRRMDRMRTLSIFSSLDGFRSEFTVADAGANFHFWPNCGDCADDLSALVHRDAVAASQRRAGTEHAENSCDALKTVLCIFQQAPRARAQSPVQISETVSEYRELPCGTACPQRSYDV